MWSAPSSTILITILQHNQPVVSFVTLAWAGALREHMKFLELIQTKWRSRMSDNRGMSNLEIKHGQTNAIYSSMYKDMVKSSGSYFFPIRRIDILPKQRTGTFLEIYFGIVNYFSSTESPLQTIHFHQHSGSFICSSSHNSASCWQNHKFTTVLSSSSAKSESDDSHGNGDNDGDDNCGGDGHDCNYVGHRGGHGIVMMVVEMMVMVWWSWWL